MKVICGYTSCKNNKVRGDLYVCSLKEISLISYFSSDEREKGERMVCEQYKTCKGYANQKL